MTKDKQTAIDSDISEIELDEELASTSSSVPEDQEKGAGTTPAPADMTIKPKRSFKRFLRSKKGISLSILLLLMVAAVVICCVPATRYGIFGMFIKKTVHVSVMDSATMKPVSKAVVSLGSQSVTTDEKGNANLSAIPSGEYKLKIAKKYYKDTTEDYVVPVINAPQSPQLHLVATGRQVAVSIVNKITQKPLAKATVAVQGTSATTDDKGMTTLVLPADKKTLAGKVTLDGYVEQDVTLKITDQRDANKLTLTPAGKVYFLSKQTGTINVMKSDLDGANASVAVQGTGNELDDSTVLLAARDWNYMALSAQREDSKDSQLYLVNAQTGKLTEMDRGDASFQLVGWSNHRFIYLVNRNNKNNWDSGVQTLKSFDADTGKITSLDVTTGSGTNYGDSQRETIYNPYILENKIVFTKNWLFGNGVAPTDKKAAIVSINPDGTQKQRVKEFGMQSFANVDSKLYEPQGIYFRVSIDSSPAEYYEYEDSAVKSVSNTDDKFFNTPYSTYLVSPSGKMTFWSESRDGKNTLIVGNSDAKNGKELASQSDFTAYGWYSDDYVLLSKNNSELYIASAHEPLSEINQPVKITNYHKPTVRYLGYGYGYGGL
jgi:hypothetical protein